MSDRAARGEENRMTCEYDLYCVRKRRQLGRGGVELRSEKHGESGGARAGRDEVTRCTGEINPRRRVTICTFFTTDDARDNARARESKISRRRSGGGARARACVRCSSDARAACRARDDASGAVSARPRRRSRGGLGASSRGGERRARRGASRGRGGHRRVRARARIHRARGRAPGAVGRHPRGDARRAPRRRRRAHPPPGLFSRARPPRGTHVFDARPERARRASRGARGHQLRRHRRRRAPARARGRRPMGARRRLRARIRRPRGIPRPRRRRTRPRPTHQTKHHARHPMARPRRPRGRRTLLPLLRSSHPPARRRNQRREQRRVERPDANADAAPSAMDDGPGASSRLRPKSNRDAAALAPCDADVAGHITRGDLRAALIDPLPRGVRLTVVLDCPEGGAGAVDLPFAFEARDAGDDFGAGSGVVETADGPAEVGRTIVVATRANATTVETMETARRVAEGVSMFASIDDEKSSTPPSRRTESKKKAGRREEEKAGEGEGEKASDRGWDEDGRRRSRSSRGRRRTPREDAAGGCCAVS